MVAFNFQKQFADAVERGEKRYTIRSERRARVGDNLQLYTGQRTKQCRLLRRSICTSVDEVRIYPRNGYSCIRFNGELLNSEGMRELARSVGFETTAQMVDYYAATYGLPFCGYRHGWSA